MKIGEMCIRDRIKHIKKEDGSTAGNEEALTFKVIEFNRDDKRIIVSHSRYLEDIRKEADQIVESEKTKEKDEIKKTIKATQSKVELSTFGDIEGFSELKEQMAASKAAAPAVESVEPVQEEPKVAKTSAKGDDLKKVEGIGPKMCIRDSSFYGPCCYLAASCSAGPTPAAGGCRAGRASPHRSSCSWPGGVGTPSAARQPRPATPVSYTHLQRC